MAKRHARQSSSTKTARIANSDSLNALEKQVIAIAEQLGRIAGTAEGRVEGWARPAALRSRLARIRTRAAQLLTRLNHNGTAVDERKKRIREKSRAKVAAPGKKHRKPPEPSRGPRPTSELTAKAIATRQRKSPHPRQG
jgi:hypothetical protein